MKLHFSSLAVEGFSEEINQDVLVDPIDMPAVAPVINTVPQGCTCYASSSAAAARPRVCREFNYSCTGKIYRDCGRRRAGGEATNRRTTTDRWRAPGSTSISPLALRAALHTVKTQKSERSSRRRKGRRSFVSCVLKCSYFSSLLHVGFYGFKCMCMWGPHCGQMNVSCYCDIDIMLT